MVEGFLYQYIYYILVSLFTIYASTAGYYLNQRILAFFLCLFLCFFIGFRPVDKVFVDMVNYHEWWSVLAEWNGFDLSQENILFDNLYNYFADGLRIESKYFFFFIAIIYFLSIYLACIKLFPQKALLSILVCLGAFSTFSYGVNGIKAGAAASLFLVALAYLDKIWISFLFLLLSWGFHHSMVLPIVAYILTFLVRKEKYYFYVWLFCFLMASAHITFFQHFFSTFSESGSGYLQSSGLDWGGKSGFRIDFVLYSSIPVFIGYLVKFKYKLVDFFYDRILNIYLLCNGVWMLCMYINFTNRIAYLSWFMYPIVLIYPSLAIEDTENPLVIHRNKIIYAHLFFSLFLFLRG